MAPAVAPERLRRLPVPDGDPGAHHEPPVAEETERRGPSRTLPRTAVACAVLVVTSLLLVAGANAYLTQGEVRLTRMQQQLTTDLGNHSDLELRVSTMGGPSTVVSKAQQHGLDAPQKVTDIPQVTTPASAATTTTAVTAGHTSTRSTGTR
ncbi:MAG TPA: hypothetical protein VMV22_00990 [Acidimicrobiales bacterium]|nr:hypothetical protein [Acidimicrobiales bacterium]